MKVTGLAEGRRDQLATEAERLIRAALAAAGLAGARALAHGGPPTPEDLAAVAERFKNELWQLVGLLAVAFAEGAAAPTTDQALAAAGITAAAEGEEELVPSAAAVWLAQIRTLYGLPTTVAEAAEAVPVASEAAIEYGVGEVARIWLERAREQLVGLSDQAWAASRDALLEGLAAGDDLRGLAGRVQAASEVPAARAAAMARSLTMHAASAGELAEVRAMATALQMDGTKRWLSAHDDRVRPTHQAADGQTVGLAEHFMVGGWPMDRPHDPAGPPEETINCRCVLSFDLSPPPPAMAASALAGPARGGRIVSPGGDHVPLLLDGGYLIPAASARFDPGPAGALGLIDAERFMAPHQPRDTRGRWTESAASSYATRWGMGDMTVDKHWQAGFKGGSAEPHLVHRKDGSVVFSKQRQALHDKIVEDTLAGKHPPEHGRPVYHVLGGGPASGKTSLLESAAGARMRDEHNARIGLDEIRSKLPEYGGGRRADFCHEEAAWLTARATRAAAERHLSVTVDTTGNSDLGTLTSRLHAAHDAGYRIEGHYVTVPLDVAISRAQARGQDTGRYVPTAGLTALHSNISRTLPEATHLFDTLELHDTRGSTPKRVMHYDGTGPPTIDSPSLWSDFLAKANAEPGIVAVPEGA